MKKSLKIKIFLFTAIPLFLLLSIQEAFLILDQKEQLALRIDKFMSHESHSLAEIIGAQLEFIQVVGELGAENVEFSDFVSYDEAIPYLAANLGKGRLLVGTRFAFEPSYNGGRLFMPSVSIPGDSIIKGDLADKINYLDSSELSYAVPKKTLQPYWEEPFQDRETGLMVCRYSAPIIKEGKFIGVSAVRFDFSELQDKVIESGYSTFPFFFYPKKGSSYFTLPKTSMG